MNRILLVLPAICLFTSVQAQSNVQQPVAQCFWETIDLPGSEPVQEALYAIQLQHPEWWAGQTKWVPIHTAKSLTGMHITYQQMVQGMPVFQATLKANLDNIGDLINYISNARETRNWPIIEKPSVNDSLRLLQLAMSQMPGAATVQKSQWVWYAMDQNVLPIPALLADLFVPAGHYMDRFIIGLEGDILFRQDLRRYLRTPVDTTVTAKVFYPNPIMSAQTNYGNAYQDFNDANTPTLNAQRFAKTMTVQFDNGEFILERPFLKMQDLDGPQIDPPIFTSPIIDVGRGDSTFEFVNAYYHLTTFQQYVESLGFTTFSSFNLIADPHGTADDNSFVTPGNTYQMILGDGGVDDAEDAGVVVHEFGHVLSDIANGNNNSGFDRQALDEGYGDYFSASYCRSITEYQWYNIFDWDGHNEYWSGRFANTNKVYPTDLGSNIYLAGEIWSSALMELWPILGRENMDKLVLESMFSLLDNMTMRDAAKILIQQEALLFNSQYYDDMYTVLQSRGLLEPLVTQIVGSYSFLRGTGNITVFLDADESEADVLVYNMQGQLLGRHKMTDQHIYVIPNSWFASDGMYIVELRTANLGMSEKAVYLKR